MKQLEGPPIRYKCSCISHTITTLMKPLGSQPTRPQKIDCHHHESNQRPRLCIVRITIIIKKFKLVTNFPQERKGRSKSISSTPDFDRKSESNPERILPQPSPRRPQLQHLA